jgi:hypothetical protein
LLEFLEQRLSGRMRTAYQQAMAQIAQGLDTAGLERLLARNDVAGALELVAKASGPAEETLRAGFREAISTSGLETQRRDTPPVLRKMPTTTFGGDGANARAALKRLELQFFPPVFKEHEKALRAVFTKGLREGINPRTLAREAKQYVGLTAYDAQLVDSFALDVRGGNYTKALTRTLRDKRFDRALRDARDGKRALTDDEIDTMSSRYRERLHAWRAETWTRSATLNAAREGQLATWQTMAKDPALLDAGLVAIKTWHTTLDGRERESHRAMNGTRRPMKESFPVDGGVQTPGQGAYNCRCTFSVSFERPVNAEAPRIPRRPDELGLTDDELQKKRKRERAIARKLKKVDPAPPPPRPTPPPPPVVVPPPPPPVLPPPTVVDKAAAKRARAAARRARARGETPTPTPSPAPTPPRRSDVFASTRSDAELTRGAREVVLSSGDATVRELRAELDAIKKRLTALRAEQDRLPFTSLMYRANKSELSGLMDRSMSLRSRLLRAEGASMHEVRTGFQAYMRSIFEDDARALGTTVSGQSKVDVRLPMAKLPAGVKSAFDEAMTAAEDFLKDVFPRFGNTPRIPVFVEVNHTGRAFARGNMISMSADHAFRTWVHEIAHVIEHNFQDAGKWGRDMRALRATSRTTTALPGYGSNERFLPGKFFEPYMGKVYPGHHGLTHTEMFSMALETLYQDPAKLLRDDPALFDALVLFLRTFRRQTAYN